MSIYDYTVKNMKNEDVSLDAYRGKVLLVVNTATGCGFTPQYEALEGLYKEYQGTGLEILDFPCNQFGNQAPGTEEEISSFCKLKYDVTFPQFKKIEVNGDNAEPLFGYLKGEQGFAGFPADNPATGLLSQIAGQMDPNWESSPDIKWNFTKFLVDRDGKVVARFEPMTDMNAVAESVKELL